MEILQTVTLQCPNCWEQIELLVDCSVAQQEFVEDCSVCCSPMIVVVVWCGEQDVHVEARPENG